MQSPSEIIPNSTWRTTAEALAALAGHRDIKMTLRYAHLAPSHLRAGIQVLEERNRYLAGLALSTEQRVTPVSQDFAGIE